MLRQSCVRIRALDLNEPLIDGPMERVVLHIDELLTGPDEKVVLVEHFVNVAFFLSLLVGVDVSVRSQICRCIVHLDHATLRPYCQIQFALSQLVVNHRQTEHVSRIVTVVDQHLYNAICWVLSREPL